MLVLERTLFVASVVMAVGWAAFVCLSRAPQKPSLVAHGATRNLGAVPAGAQVVVPFTLTANETVRIIRVVTSCSCAATALESQELRAGDQTLLELRWTVPSYSGEARAQVSVIYHGETAPAGDFAVESLTLDGWYLP